jgi:hypothetical protein
MDDFKELLFIADSQLVVRLAILGSVAFFCLVLYVCLCVRYFSLKRAKYEESFNLSRPAQALFGSGSLKSSNGVKHKRSSSEIRSSLQRSSLSGRRVNSCSSIETVKSRRDSISSGHRYRPSYISNRSISSDGESENSIKSNQ